MKNEKSGFKVVIDGDLTAISSDVLISNLMNTVNILQETNKNLRGPKLQIWIEPFAPGSFEIHYALLFSSVASGIAATLTKEAVSHLIRLTAQFFNLKKFLRGKVPAEIVQEGDNVRIKNNYGNVIIVDRKVIEQYKNSGPINDSVNKIFRTLEEEKEIDTFQLLSQDRKELFRAGRADFSGMHTHNEMLYEDTKEKVINKAILVVYRVVFAEDRKWAFVFQDTIISAYITDHEFFEHLNDFRFGNGDRLEADLKILQRFDDVAKAYINIEYEVIKIYSIKPREEQKKLDFRQD